MNEDIQRSKYVEGRDAGMLLALRTFQSFLNEALAEETISEEFAEAWNAVVDRLDDRWPPAKIRNAYKVNMTVQVTITASVSVTIECDLRGVSVETTAEVDGTYTVPRGEVPVSIDSGSDIDPSGRWEHDYGTDIEGWLDSLEDEYVEDWEITYGAPQFEVRS